MNRDELAGLIYNRILEERDKLKKQYDLSKDKIGCFYIDNLLPENFVHRVNECFPDRPSMVLKKSLKENKHVAAQMDLFDPLLEEVLYAFQDQKVVRVIKEICNIDDLQPDEYLYAGGISSMGKGQFLNPHLDNSHDKDREKWRVLNLLFYVSPNWAKENGGHLELWPNGINENQIVVESKFNRLVVMSTHQNSWHSVSPVIANSSRNCISNYFFSDRSLEPGDKFHVTTFRGRPNQIIVNQILKIDSFLRMGIRKIFRKGIVKNPHVYKK